MYIKIWVPAWYVIIVISSGDKKLLAMASAHVLYKQQQLAPMQVAGQSDW